MGNVFLLYQIESKELSSWLQVNYNSSKIYEKIDCKPNIVSIEKANNTDEESIFYSEQGFKPFTNRSTLIVKPIGCFLQPSIAHALIKKELDRKFGREIMINFYKADLILHGYYTDNPIQYYKVINLPYEFLNS